MRQQRCSVCYRVFERVECRGRTSKWLVGASFPLPCCEREPITIAYPHARTSSLRSATSLLSSPEVHVLQNVLPHSVHWDDEVVVAAAVKSARTVCRRRRRPTLSPEAARPLAAAD